MVTSPEVTYSFAMNGQDLTERLRDDNETAFSRLGSSKALYAVTGGEMDADHVRAAAADEAAIARQTFDAWAADEEDEAAAELFAAVAEESAEQYDTVATGDHEPTDSLPMYDTLAGLEGTPARVGGLLGRALVTTKTVEQMVGFFIGDANPKSADTFRGLRGELEAQRDDVAELLDDVCSSATDWDDAESAATALVEAAYADYVETLEGMGIKPKNVC
ncbi:MAG: transcription antitermination protein [Halobacteriota archaeon]